MKNVGLMHHEKCLARLRVHNSEVVIIVALMNPAHRALSAYEFFKIQGSEIASSFREALYRW